MSLMDKVRYLSRRQFLIMGRILMRGQDVGWDVTMGPPDRAKGFLGRAAIHVLRAAAKKYSYSQQVQ